MPDQCSSQRAVVMIENGFRRGAKRRDTPLPPVFLASIESNSRIEHFENESNRAVSQPLSAQPVAETAQKTPTVPVRALTFHYPSNSKPGVGTGVDAAADGLQAGQRVELMWETVTGGWIVEKILVCP